MDQELRQKKMILYFGDGLDYKWGWRCWFFVFCFFFFWGGGARFCSQSGQGKRRERKRRCNFDSWLCFSLQILVKNESVHQSFPTLQPHELYGAHQAPLSMGFSRWESWSGLPFLSSGDLMDPGIEPRSPALQTDSLPCEPPGKPLFLAK